MKMLARLQKRKECWFMIIIASIFFLLRLPSLFEPHWYGDEAIYETIGIAMNNGRLLYKDIWDNKPPLLYILYALVHGDQFWIRLLSLMAGIGAIFSFFGLAGKLFSSDKHTFSSEKAIVISTALFAVLFGLPLLEGNIANSENFMLFPTLLAALGIFVYLKSKKIIFLWYSGLLLSVSFLLKAVGIFDTVAFAVFLFIVTYEGINKLPKQLKILFPFIGAFVIPIMATTVVFFLQGSLTDFLSATFKQNVGYVGYGNKFIIPQGFLYLKLLLLGIFTTGIFLRRKKLIQPVIFVAIWLGFSVFNAFFSQRPYTHYMLVLLPSYCLLIGVIIKSIIYVKSAKQIEANHIRKVQNISIVIALIIALLLLKNFNFYTKTTGYYQNFISFIFSKKDMTSYRNFFDRQTARDYEVAQFIKNRLSPKSSVFIWGNNPQIYVLSHTLPPGRYTVAYHITASKQSLMETQDALIKNTPQYIIVLPANAPFPYRMSGYIHRFTLENAQIYEKIL